MYTSTCCRLFSTIYIFKTENDIDLICSQQQTMYNVYNFLCVLYVSEHQRGQETSVQRSEWCIRVTV